MRWLQRVLRIDHPAVAPRDDPPPRLQEAQRAIDDAERLRREIRKREITMREALAELRTAREENHIPDRVAAMIHERRRHA